MFLKSLYLYNFKSYEKRTFSFSKRINCFVGENGIGKTNVLDAIYFSCLTKSYFNATDQQLIRHHQASFIIEADYSIESASFKIKCLQARQQKKDFFANDIRYEKLSKHIGLLPVVMVAPDDQILIYGGSEERRKLIDATLSQTDAAYLQALQEYNRYITQRNALLKQFAEQQYFDSHLLLAYDTHLAPLNDFIYERRQAFIDAFSPIFQQIHEQLVQHKEKVFIAYETDLAQEKGKQLLLQNIDKDRIMKRTTTGIHRDDWVFSMNGEVIKKFGSQGQQKTFLFALKLAQAFYLKQKTGKEPLLLLDDIFDKLDAARSYNLLHFLHQHYTGQIFITDTQRQRLISQLKDYLAEVEIFEAG